MAVHGEHATWGVREELLAATVDRLGEVSYLLQKAWFKGEPELPRLVPRPGQDGSRPTAAAEPPKMSSKEEIRAFFRGSGTEVKVSSS